MRSRELARASRAPAGETRARRVRARGTLASGVLAGWAVAGRMLAGGVLASGMLAGCAPPPVGPHAPAQGGPGATPARSDARAEAPEPAPSPGASAQLSPGGSADSPGASPDTPEGSADDARPVPEAPTAPPAPREPVVTITLDEPYKLDGRPPPKTQEEYKRDILDQRHWNGGGLGDLVGELPGVDNHPDPRVIVNVEAIQGKHDERQIVVFTRKHHWIEVVRCYRLGAYKDPHLRGWTRARVTLSAAGKATAARMIETELDDEAVARCMVDRLRDHSYPSAASGSQITFAMRVGPGDEPMPPPDDLIVPGDGELSLEAMRAGVEAGLPAFEACYRAAFAYAPGLWGRMILRFHLTEHGKLDEAFQVNRRFPDPRVSQCVEHAARKLSFPRPDGGELRFVVPLRFSSDHADTTPPSSSAEGK